MNILRVSPLILALTTFVTSMGLQAMPTDMGLPVQKIPHANQIEEWLALDKTHLIVSISSNKNYLVTLRQACHTLGFTSKLGVSSSNNTVYAGFDYITADGQRCAIQRINKITRAEKRALTKA